MRFTARTTGNTTTAIRARIIAAALAVVVAGVAGYPPTPAAAGPVRAADQVRDRSWHLTQLRVTEAHRVTQGEGITVAVIDTGVDATHPDLAGNVLPGFDMLDPANTNRGHRDYTGHGTAMASLIAGRGHGQGGRDGVLGIAPKAKILPINIYNPERNELAKGVLVNAILRAIDEGADVVCIASGGASEPGEPQAVQYARQRNVLIVAGVGNSPNPLPGSPANIPEVVAVTGTDRAGNIMTTVRGDIDIAAPGSDIISARASGRYDTATGTSNSTAIVSGAVALIRAKYPNADRNEQLRRLVWTSKDVGDRGKDNIYGWGALNLVDAVTVEPREPAGATAPAPTSSSPQQVNAAPPGRDDGSSERVVAIVLVGGALLLAVIVGLAVLALVRARRRRASATESNGLSAAESMH